MIVSELQIGNIIRIMDKNCKVVDIQPSDRENEMRISTYDANDTLKSKQNPDKTYSQCHYWVPSDLEVDLVATN